MNSQTARQKTTFGKKATTNMVPETKKEKDRNIMNSQREIQNRYAELLDVCYHQYRSGRRCKFENDEEWRYNCSNCPENSSNRFCRVNLMVKKLIRLLAESMVAEGLLKEPEGTTGSQGKGAPITEEHIKNFKQLNLAVALSSPKVKDTIWLVPERTGNHEFEITPEDARILDAVTTSFGADLVEVTSMERQ